MKLVGGLRIWILKKLKLLNFSMLAGCNKSERKFVATKAASKAWSVPSIVRKNFKPSLSTRDSLGFKKWQSQQK